MSDMDEATLRVVVADDQPIIRDGFAAVLDAQPDMEVVGRASDGAEVVDLVRRTRPDVALVDIRMPRLDGIAATAQISAVTRVVMLTTFDLDEYVRDALAAGASGFLLKDVPAARLVDAVRLVADGAMLLGPALHRRLLLDSPTAPVDVDRALSDLGLTTREREVFAHLVRGRSNAEIAEAGFVSVQTVKSHVAEILRKLGLRDRVQVVVHAYENGLVPRDPGGGSVTGAPTAGASGLRARA